MKLEELAGLKTVLFDIVPLATKKLGSHTSTIPICG